MSLTPDVLVIGGGFAGLSAATAMAEAGLRVVVVEARKALGGRASSFPDPVTAEHVDNGQHVLFGCYRETFKFLHRIGSDAEIRRQPTLAIDVIDQRGLHTRLACPSLPAPFHLLVGLVRWRALSWGDRFAATRMAGPLAAARKEAAGARLSQVDRRALPREAETVRAWLVRHGQTERLLTCLWEPLAVSALNESMHQAAARPFARVLGMLFSTDARDAAIALPRKSLNAVYVPAATAYVEARGGQVRHGLAARLVSYDGAGVCVRVGDELLKAQAVVIAVAWHALDDLLEARSPGLDQVVAQSRGVRASPIVSVNFWLERPLPIPAPFVGLTGGPFHWVFDRSRIIGPTVTHITVVASAAEALIGLPNDDIAEQAWVMLDRALPDLRAVGRRRTLVVRERRATFSLAPGSPKRPGTMTDVPNVVLAGDWVDTGLPATIEGAVVSGHRAASAVRAHVVPSARSVHGLGARR